MSEERLRALYENAEAMRSVGSIAYRKARKRYLLAQAAERRKRDMRREICEHHEECPLSSDRLPCGYEIAGCVEHCAENRRRNERKDEKDDSEL
jgi:hypothetical protein